MGAVLESLRKRGDVELGRFDWSAVEGEGSQRLIGHHLVYGYLLRQVLSLMQSTSEQAGGELGEPVSVGTFLEGESASMLRLTIPLSCDLSMDEEVAFRESLEPMDYLAQTMQGAVYFSDESWSVTVRLLAHYPEERA